MEQSILPRHIGIIMDGNGRWAKKRGLPRSAGHTAGAAVFKTIVRYSSSIGIKYLTIYAFSTENWKRPKDEIGTLILLFQQYLEDALRDFLNENIKVLFMGDTSAFPDKLQKLIDETEKVSANKTGMVLNIALNYGGRAEITRAVQLLAQDVKNGKIAPEQIDDTAIESRLYTAGQPDPDLIIRPSGEYRISNFLLWQSAYSEYMIMDILWPDFKTKDLDRAIEEYANRNRRFGGI
jgi:undecaprenyl diphosphate synthase